MTPSAAAYLTLVSMLLASGTGTGSPRAWPRVYVTDPGIRLVLERALDRIAVRLGDPVCQSIFSTFRDTHGRPLSDRLGELGVTPVEYLQLVVFVDGGHHARCGTELAYTHPGSRVVYVCPRQFEGCWWRNPEHAEAAIIHEALHTLGLGENPPSSSEITNRVRRVCGSRPLIVSRR